MTFVPENERASLVLFHGLEMTSPVFRGKALTPGVTPTKGRVVVREVNRLGDVYDVFLAMQEARTGSVIWDTPTQKFDDRVYIERNAANFRSLDRRIVALYFSKPNLRLGLGRFIQDTLPRDFHGVGVIMVPDELNGGLTTVYWLATPASPESITALARSCGATVPDPFVFGRPFYLDGAHDPYLYGQRIRYEGGEVREKSLWVPPAPVVAALPVPKLGLKHRFLAGFR